MMVYRGPSGQYLTNATNGRGVPDFGLGGAQTNLAAQVEALGWNEGETPSHNA